MELSSSKIKKILIFSQKKAFLLFSQKKAFLIFPKTEPCTFQQARKIKNNPLAENFLYFRKRKPRSGNSKKILLFQEVTCKARKINKKSALKKFLVSYDVFTNSL